VCLAGGVGGRTEGGGEDNSDRQPHFLTILSDYKKLSFFFFFFFFLFFSLISRLTQVKMGRRTKNSQVSNTHTLALMCAHGKTNKILLRNQ
jgi:choline-glycine betaine transporter